MKHILFLPIVISFSSVGRLKAFVPMPATTTPTLNSSARFYSSPEESAFTADIKIQIQEDRTRDIKELEVRKNSEIQALKHELATTMGVAPTESLHSSTKSNTDRIVDLSPEECAQALTHFMAKSHEEKLNALKHLKENKDAVIKALKKQLQMKKEEASSFENTEKEYSETILDLSRKIESAQKFISTYVVRKQEEKQRAIADAENVIAKKYDEKLKAFLLNPVPSPEQDLTEGRGKIDERGNNRALFERRTAKVVAAANVGQSRWGNMEVKKATHTVTTVVQTVDHKTTSATLFDKKNSFASSAISGKILMNDAMLLYCSAMHIRLKRVV